jgi:hypothetical protein
MSDSLVGFITSQGQNWGGGGKWYSRPGHQIQRGNKMSILSEKIYVFAPNKL